MQTTILGRMQMAFLILVTTFVLLEAVVRLVPLERKPEPFFSDKVASEFLAQPWAEQYQREHQQLNFKFLSYELYVQEPFVGTAINIDKDSYRKTSPSRSESLPKAKIQVGVFGGSTMWGTSVPDASTTPSQLARALEITSEKSPFDVKNYAEVGYVHSQELHRAIRLLYSRNEVPNIFIFVDGLNDSTAAYTNRGQGVMEPAGLPWEHEKYRHLFKLGRTEVSTVDVLKKSKTLRLMINAAERAGLRTPDVKSDWHPPDDKAYEKLAGEVAESYLRTVKATHAALKGEGRKAIFVLQPLLAHKNELSKDEKMLAGHGEKWFPYVRLVYDRIREGAKALPKDVAFFDRSELFKDIAQTCYWDVFHYSIEGNRMLAESLAEIVREATGALAPAGSARTLASEKRKAKGTTLPSDKD